MYLILAARVLIGMSMLSSHGLFETLYKGFEELGMAYEDIVEEFVSRRLETRIDQ